MNLTEHQFNLLAYLKGRPGAPLDLAREGAGVPADAWSETWRGLLSREWIDEGSRTVTDSGTEALEPYRAKRAVLMAAGFGSRLLPLTLTTPKPLVRVNGKRIIDTLLDAIIAAGIEEIYVVRGYLADRFDALLEDYPAVRFIENPDYRCANNISSILAARRFLSNCYVFEADLFLHNQGLVTPYRYHSDYLGVPVAHTDDWAVVTDESGRILRLQLSGGAEIPRLYHFFGVAYWTAEDGKRLAEDIEDVYRNMPEARKGFYDEVPLNIRHDRYRVYARSCRFEDVSEIDTVAELSRIDPAYAPLIPEKDRVR